MGKHLTPSYHQGPVTSLAFKSNFLYVGQGNYLKIYDIEKSTLLFADTIFSINRVHGIIPLSSSFVVVWGGRSLYFGNPNEKNAKEYVCKDWIVSISLSLDERFIFVLMGHNQCLKIELEQMQVVESYSCAKTDSILYSGSVHVSQDSVVIAAGTVLHGVVLWDAKQGSVVSQFTEHYGSIFGLAFSVSGLLLSSCSDDRSIKIWDLEKSECLATLWGHFARIWNLEFINNDKNLISVSEDCTAKIWDLETNTCVKTVMGHSGRNIWALATQKNNVFATGGSDGRIMLWNTQNKGIHGVYSVQDIAGNQAQSQGMKPNRILSFKDFESLDGLLLASLSNGTIHRHTEDTGWEPLELKVDAFTMVRRTRKHLVVCTRTGNIHIFAPSESLEPQFSFSIPGSKNIMDIFMIEVQGKDTLFVDFNNPSFDYELYSLTGECLGVLKRAQVKAVTSVSCFGRQILLGSRKGSIAIYPDYKVDQPPVLYERVFGNADAITTMSACFDDILVGSRSGWYGIFSLSSNALLNPLTINKLQRGTIEGAQTLENGDLLFYGFHSDFFYLWNETSKYEVLFENCGGSHRVWKFFLDPTNPNMSQLMFTRVAELNTISFSANTSKAGPRLLQGGTHGREIRGLEFHPKQRQLMACASEDTCVNLAIVGDTSTRLCLSLRNHVSGVQALHWSPDGSFLMTSGGREELLVWKVYMSDAGRVDAHEIARLPTVSSSPDLRIMDFSISDDPEPILAVAYSDSTIRLWKFVEHREFKLLCLTRYRECCILQIRLARLSGRHMLLTSSTDGSIVVWAVAHDWSSLMQVATQFAHQSGVLALAVESNLNLENIFICSGGDDNSIKGFNLGSNLEFSTVFCIESAHASTVTSIALKETHLITTGRDQKVQLWSRTGELLEIHYAAVCDTDVLAVCEDRVAVAGSGISVYNVSKSQISN